MRKLVLGITVLLVIALMIGVAVFKLGLIPMNADVPPSGLETRFIPIAVDLLTSMLGMPHVSDDQKVLIHEALIERANDPDLSFMDEKIPDFKEPEKRPIILNSESVSSRFTRK